MATLLSLILVLVYQLRMFTNANITEECLELRFIIRLGEERF